MPCDFESLALFFYNYNLKQSNCFWTFVRIHYSIWIFNAISKRYDAAIIDQSPFLCNVILLPSTFNKFRFIVWIVWERNRMQKIPAKIFGWIRKTTLVLSGSWFSQTCKFIIKGLWLDLIIKYKELDNSIKI